MLETLFKRFFNDEVLDEVVQLLAKKQRLFKTKLGSTVVCFNKHASKQDVFQEESPWIKDYWY